MRVSTAGAYQRGLDMLARLQSALDRTQQQVASGRRLLAPSDDPIGAARAVEMRESVARLEQFDRNAAIAENRLNYEESTLADVNDVLQRVRELAIQANNDTLSTEARREIAVELRERVNQLVALANQRDGTGRYLFAGTVDETRPVSVGSGGFSYNGDQGQRLIQIGEDRQIPDGDSGAFVFFAVRDGNGSFSLAGGAGNTGTGVLGHGSVVDPAQYDRDSYTVTFTAPGAYEVRDSGGALVTTGTHTPGQTIAFRGIEFTLDGTPDAGDSFVAAPSANRDMFSIVADLATVLETPAESPAARAALHNGVNGALANLDQAIGRVLDVRTQVGSRLAAIDSQAETNATLELSLKATISDIEDLDYAEALTRLSLEATALEAAQKSFLRTQGLSLFNYL